MRTIWIFIGRALYWVSYPALLIYLNGSKRTRILVRYKNKLLVMKGWYGDNKWILPGGGLHRREDSLLGAIREMKEEAGVTLEPSELKLLFNGKVRHNFFLRYHAIVFGVDVNEEFAVDPKGVEVSEVVWLPIDTLLTESSLLPILPRALEAWDRLA